MFSLLFAATVLVLAAPWLTLISGLLIPLIVGIITKQGSSTGKKSLLTIFLSILSALGAALVANDGVLTTESLMALLITLGLALGAFYGIYSPLNTDAKLFPTQGL